MRLSQNPCFKCPLRRIGCKSKCMIWKKLKIENSIKNAKMKAEKDREKAIDDFIFNAPHRITLDACRRANKRARA